LFFTYGLRAVYNPNIGEDQNPNLEPRYGIAFSRDFLGVTAKIRGSYGTATRPPGRGAKEEGMSEFESVNNSRRRVFGTAIDRLANPDLVPSSQQGGEGGLELYFGSRGSLVVTRYNQTVDNLDVAPVVDSVPLLPAIQAQFGVGPWALKLNQVQDLNLGSVRNQGWEAKGTLNVGAISAAGTFSWNKSRLIGITPRYRNQFPQYVVGAAFDNIPEHTYGLGFSYARGKTRVAYNLQGQGMAKAPSGVLSSTLGDYRLMGNRPRMEFPLLFKEVFPGFPLGDLNASRQFTSNIEVILHVVNVTNSFQGDIDPLVPQSGRMTSVGIRMRF
jgi:hypothetical protein